MSTATGMDWPASHSHDERGGMKPSSRGLGPLVSVTLLACLVLAACGSSEPESAAPSPATASVESMQEDSASQTSPATVNAPSASLSADAPRVGVVLPDAEVGMRWQDVDRPALERSFAARGLSVDIRNAQGSPERFVGFAQQLASEQVNLLVVSSLDDASGAAAISAAQQAGIPVIELDHLTNGGRANFYVGPDPTASGQVLGEGLLRCMRESGNENGPVAMVNGPASDGVAAAMKQGYLTSIVGGGYVIRSSEDVPGWSPSSAGALFERMFTMSNGDLVGVVAASEGLTEAVTAVLDRYGKSGNVQAPLVPVAGVGSSPAALQRVLIGSQCVTVFTSPTAQAEAVAALASAIVTGDGSAIAGLATGRLTDAGSGVEVQSVLLQPQPVFAGDVPGAVEGGLVPAAVLCQPPEVQQACTRAGIKVR